MIDDRTKYNFVTGDLGKIVVDGEIMPLRSNKDIMRGEDLTWLAEWAGRCMEFFNPYSGTSWNFSNKVTASQITSLRNRVGGQCTGNWAKTETFNHFYESGTNYKTPFEAYPSSFEDVSLAPCSPLTSFHRDHISTMFEAVEKCKLGVFVKDIRHTEAWLYDVEKDASSGTPPSYTHDSPVVFSYNMVQWPSISPYYGWSYERATKSRDNRATASTPISAYANEIGAACLMPYTITDHLEITNYNSSGQATPVVSRNYTGHGIVSVPITLRQGSYCFPYYFATYRLEEIFSAHGTTIRAPSGISNQGMSQEVVVSIQGPTCYLIWGTQGDMRW